MGNDWFENLGSDCKGTQVPRHNINNGVYVGVYGVRACKVHLVESTPMKYNGVYVCVYAAQA